MRFIVKKHDKNLFGTIHLPASKSISNRLLVIKGLQPEININHLSESEDTRVMENAFNTTVKSVDVGHAGTAMRFLTAYFANTPGEWFITGSDRMKNRPVQILVDALKQLGAEIEYAEKQGFPPLKIKGRKLSGNKISIDGSISSQYISALLLIAPSLQGGLTLELINKISSKPYIRLTLELMKYFGVNYTWENNKIEIHHQIYLPKNISVEADWSGASYWYEMASAGDEVELLLTGLHQESLQGDSIIATLFEKFGVFSEFSDAGVRLTKRETKATFFEFDFTDYPDMIQTFVVTCVLHQVPFKLSGAESLRIKETDRIKALQNELYKVGVEIIETSAGVLEWNGKTEKQFYPDIEIQTYNDHRMAMAFAPLAMKTGSIIIENPDVVIKSYPDFWEDIKSTGFSIEKI